MVLPYATHGVQLYGNVIIASPKLLAENPKAVSAVLRGFNRALKDTLANPAAAIAYVKERDPLINVPLETRRLKLALDHSVLTAEVRANGLGAVTAERMQRSLAETAEAYGLSRVPAAAELFNPAFLPARAERMVK